MKKIQIYLMPIIVVALLLLVAGCSTDGNGVASVDTDGVGENVSDGIEDLLGGFSEDGDSYEIDDGVDDVNENEGGGNIPRVLIGDGGLDRKDTSNDLPIAPLKLENRGEVDLDDADYGVDYDTTVQLKIRGGVKPYILSVEGLPLGSMVFDGDTRKITGQASELGDFTLQVRVTDAEGVVSDPLEKRLSVKDKYTIELRYHDADINDAGSIPFDDKVLSAHVVGGHAQSYTWKVKIDGEVVDPNEGDDPKTVSFELPDLDAAKEKEFAVEISVVDEFGNEASLNPTVTRDLNPCASPLKIQIDENESGENSLGGVTILGKGGKGNYGFWITLDQSVILYDLDGKEMDRKVELDEEGGNSPEKVNVSKTELNEGGYDIDVLSFPKMSGVAGYRVEGRVVITDKQCDMGIVRHFSIEKKETIDTLADLKMICDFEDIKHSDTGDSYLEFDIYTKKGAVAQVHYDLTTCNGREENCEEEEEEEERQFKKIESSNVNLASIDLNEITNIRYKVHKKRKKTSFWRVVGAIATAGISASVSTKTADKKKLDVDVQWCRFYTDNWFAIWDDQKHGNVLNDNEVGGRHRASARALRTKFIIDRMEGDEDSGNIWFMNDMLESVASDSEDGFDYMTIRDNDCSDGEHDWCD